MDDMITVATVAAALQTSEDTVLRLIRMKKLNANRLHERARWRVIKQSVIEYAAQNNLPLIWTEPMQQ